MMDVKIEYSPVYWLHNQTLVPTTTTTTQRTTSTTFQSTTKDRPLSSSSFNPDKSDKGSTEKVQSSRSSSLSFSLKQAIIVVASICVIIY